MGAEDIYSRRIEAYMRIQTRMQGAFQKLSTMRMTRATLQLGDEQLASRRRRHQMRETERKVQQIAAYRQDYMKKFWKLRSSSSVLNYHGPTKKRHTMPLFLRGKYRRRALTMPTLARPSPQRPGQFSLTLGC